jgi:pyruvate/2-oxoglutarate dehydrogenase complex dihydrolipoamide acyltransferase (E2) component
MATQVIPVMLGGDASSLRIAEAVSRFIADPKGLTITAKSKSGSIGFIELMSIRDPASLLAKADIQVTSDGAPAAPAPARAAPAPAAPAAPAARPPSPQASAGGIAGAAGAGAAGQTAKPAAPAAMQTQRLTGLAAWNALVGNSISGKNSDGDALTEYYLRDGTVKQLADDETATGKWTVKGEKVCFKYPDEDEDCYRITVDGDVATFTEDDGSGRRYQVLKGNPKKL